VELVASERDKNIVGQTYDDSRLDDARNSIAHEFNNGNWSSLGLRSMELGSGGLPSAPELHGERALAEEAQGDEGSRGARLPSSHAGDAEFYGGAQPVVRAAESRVHHCGGGCSGARQSVPVRAHTLSSLDSPWMASRYDGSIRSPYARRNRITDPFIRTFTHPLDS
jgi:hypothetical protein